MFYELRNSTTTFANEVIENFYHIADGDRLPRSPSGSLPEINGTYNLGSSAYNWRKIFCDTFYSLYSIPSSIIINQETSVRFTSTASEIEFTGLNGDESDYLITMLINPLAAGSGGVTETCRVIFNGDSAASYSEKYLYYNSSVIDMSTSSGNNNINITDEWTPITKGCFVGYISGRTGQSRIIKGTSYFQSQLSQSSIYVAGMWNNTLDTLTSIKFFRDFGLNSEITLWRI